MQARPTIDRRLLEIENRIDALKRARTATSDGDVHAHAAHSLDRLLRSPRDEQARDDS